MSLPQRHRRWVLLLLTLAAGSTTLLAISAWYYFGLKLGTRGEFGIGAGGCWVTWTDPEEVGGSEGPGGLYVYRRGPPKIYFFLLAYERQQKSVHAPLWPIPLTLAALALSLHFRHKRRTRRGLCPDCAYDLSAMNHPACPECGHPTRSLNS